MSLSVTSLNSPISASRSLPALPSPKDFNGPVSRVAPVQPDSPRQAHLVKGDADHGHATGLQKASPDPNSAGRPLEPRLLRSNATLFVAQLLGQSSNTAAALQTDLEQNLQGQRDAAALGSDLYRRAGGEPAILSDKPTFLSLNV